MRSIAMYTSSVVYHVNTSTKLFLFISVTTVFPPTQSMATMRITNNITLCLGQPSKGTEYGIISNLVPERSPAAEVSKAIVIVV